MESALQVRRAVESDWATMRLIRLEALQQAPLAFASTYERERSFPDAVWRSRIAESAQFLAYDDGGLVGTATGFVDPAEPDVVRLVAMYVVPAARGRGCAGRLVEAVVSDARARGFRAVVLDVVEDNIAARHAYERYGFALTGRTAPLPHAPDLAEIEMIYRLP